MVDSLIARPQQRDDAEEEHFPGSRRSAFFVLRRTAHAFRRDQGVHLAAALTYYAVLSLFPALLALLALLGVVGQAQPSIEKIVQLLEPLVSADTLDRIRPLLVELADTDWAGATLVVGLVVALWSATAYVGAFGVAMNRVYEVEEGRPLWRVLAMRVLVTVVAVLLCAIALVILIVSGPVARSAGDLLGVGEDTVRLWDVAKWPVLALAVIVAVGLLYHVTPNVKFGKVRIITVGAFVAILVWVVASAGFAFYVANFSHYDRTYGSVGGVIVGLLWLWITNLALLMGAELDAELERGRELRRGLAAEEQLQLPVRDDRRILKSAAREKRAVARMREIRVAAGGPGNPEDRPFRR